MHSTPSSSFLNMLRTFWLFSLIGTLTLSAATPTIHEQISQAGVFQEPLAWVGDNPPSEGESLKLWEALTLFKSEGADSALAAIENFLGKYTNSSWAPSVRSVLGKYYREHGRYTPALEHWELAWNLTKDAPAGTAKRVADFTLVNWTRLLASLGRVDQLSALFKETEGRVLDGGPLQQIFFGTKEGFRTMRMRPGLAYRCGTFALNSVALAMKVTNDVSELLRLESPANGFPMTELLSISGRLRLDLIPVRRPHGTELIVPSVIHWKQNHYAAITESSSGVYKVVDPTFGYPLWLTAETINSEASGAFMVPKDRMPRGWKKISEEEMTAIFGKGYPNEIQDSDDQHPCKCPPGPCPPGSGPDSYPKCYACRDFFGMPAWRISEPYITLWVEDEPLGYQPARGDRVAFQIFYKQRDDVVRSTNWFSVGTLWNSSWLSYVEQSETNTAVMYVPGGGKRRYTVDGTTLQIDSNTRMERLTNGGGALTGYRVLYRDGSLDVYDFVVTGATWTNAFLTAQVNRVGQTNRFQYTNYVNGVVRLLRVIDAQNQTNLIYYATNHAYSSNLIARVVDPFGRQTTLEYDSLGHVTNVVDVGGLTNVFKYDSAGWMTNLITPYGTNVFELSGNTNYWGTNAPDGEINRYARITEPNGTSKHLYVYRDLSSWLPSILWEDGPIDLPELTTSLWDFSYPLYRNSFYWNHRQYAAISEDGKADFSQMLNSDYGLARLRHWQHKHVAEGANSSVGPTLAVEIEGYPTHPTTSPKTSEF